MTKPLAKQDDESTGSSLGSFALGAAVAGIIGAGLGLLFAPKSGKETRQDIADSAHKAAKRFKKTRAQVEATLTEIFGEVTDTIREEYLDLKGHVLALVHEAEEKGKGVISKAKYEQIVDQAILASDHTKKWAKGHVAKMSAALKADWDEIAPG
jgi:gas vesicle protein